MSVAASGGSRKSLFLSIVLGCALFIAAGLFITHGMSHYARGAEMARGGMSKTSSKKSGHKTMDIDTEEKTRDENVPDNIDSGIREPQRRPSSWFFLIFAFVLFAIIVVVVRFVSRWELNSAEKRWRKSCQKFLARTRIYTDDF